MRNSGTETAGPPPPVPLEHTSTRNVLTFWVGDQRRHHLQVLVVQQFTNVFVHVLQLQHRVHWAGPQTGAGGAGGAGGAATGQPNHFTTVQEQCWWGQWGEKAKEQTQKRVSTCSSGHPCFPPPFLPRLSFSPPTYLRCTPTTVRNTTTRTSGGQRWWLFATGAPRHRCASEAWRCVPNTTRTTTHARHGRSILSLLEGARKKEKNGSTHNVSNTKKTMCQTQKKTMCQNTKKTMYQNTK